MSTMPLTEVKAHLSEIADEVDRTHERVHVTRNGREYVVLIAAEDLESLEATLELLSDDAAIKRVREADAAAAAGDLTTAVDMAALMDERRRRKSRAR
jgi:antitoxin YefM